MPTDATVTCSDLPTFVETAAVADFSATFVRLLVEVVVAKKVLLVAVGDGEGVAVGSNGTKMRSGSPGVGVTVGIGDGFGVGVGSTVGVGEGVGVGVGTGVTSFAPGNEIAKRVVPGKKETFSHVKLSLATSPMYSRKFAPSPSAKTRTLTFASPTRTLIRPSAPEHPEPINCGISVRE